MNGPAPVPWELALVMRGSALNEQIRRTSAILEMARASGDEASAAFYVARLRELRLHSRALAEECALQREAAGRATAGGEA